MSDLHERDALAADYVCGLLDPAAEREAERLMQNNNEFKRAVEQWRERLSGFDRSADASAPPDVLWQRIEAGLSRPAPASARKASRLTDWWNSISLWRITALGALATALILIVGIALRERANPVMVAVLIDGDRAGAVVHVFKDGRAELLPLTDIPVPADRALQVWTLPSRERGPVSVGLMERAHTLALSLKDLPVTNADQLFEITLEPKGGSPIGRPTGPILFKGLASRPL